jgi:Holliday junction resolvase RusA-like endonuclease
MIRFQIIGETPSKKNSKIWTKGHKLIPSKAYQVWHMDAGIQIASQIARMAASDRPVAEGTNVEGIDYPVAVTLTFYHGDQVRRDSDNQAASIMDLLQDEKVLADDRWQIVRILNIYNHFDKGNPRCLIEINRL